MLHDDGDTPDHTWVIPAGFTVPANGRLTIDQNNGGVTGFPFGLGNGGDKVRLFQSDGTTSIDQVTWAASAGPANTWSRCPDTTGPNTFNAVPASKGLSNVNSCLTVTNTVKINEVSQKGSDDWIELQNTGAAAQDLTGWSLKDSTENPIALSGSIAAGAIMALDTSPTFSLDTVDAARLVGPVGNIVLDTFTWQSDTDTTYVRCAGFTPLQKSVAATKNAANNCRVGATWPGGSSVTEVDPADTFTTNLSGLAYQGTGTTTPGSLWAVVNGGPSKLYKLVNSAGTWQPDTGDWATGKVFKYPNGTGEPDAEGVTLVNGDPADGIFVATERDNTNNGVSRPSILSFNPNDAGTTLTATHECALVGDLPGLGANFGLEAIAWVPDSYLTAKGFKDQHLDKTYAPADYANHGTGLFLVGVEATGNVHAYALDLTSNSFQQVATFDSGFPSVIDLSYDPEKKEALGRLRRHLQRPTHAASTSNGSGAFAATDILRAAHRAAELQQRGVHHDAPQRVRGRRQAGLLGRRQRRPGRTTGHSIRQGTLELHGGRGSDGHVRHHRSHQPGRGADLHADRVLHRRLRQPGRDHDRGGVGGGLHDHRRRGQLQPPGLLRGQGRPGGQRRLQRRVRPADDHRAEGQHHDHGQAEGDDDRGHRGSAGAGCRYADRERALRRRRHRLSAVAPSPPARRR